jgi:hypothetical protein
MNIYREIKITAQEKRGPVKTRCKDKENIVCSPRQKKIEEHNLQEVGISYIYFSLILANKGTTLVGTHYKSCITITMHIRL